MVCVGPFSQQPWWRMMLLHLFQPNTRRFRRPFRESGPFPLTSWEKRSTRWSHPEAWRSRNAGDDAGWPRSGLSRGAVQETVFIFRVTLDKGCQSIFLSRYCLLVHSACSKEGQSWGLFEPIYHCFLFYFLFLSNMQPHFRIVFLYTGHNKQNTKIYDENGDLSEYRSSILSHLF